MSHQIKQHAFSQLLNSQYVLRANRAEIQPYMKLLLEQFRAAIRVANIFRRVAARGEMQTDRAALEFRLHAADALPVRMIEPFRNPKYRRDAARETLIGIIQRAIGRMIPGRLCFSIVITNGGGDKIPVAAVESGDVAVESEIFAVLVMPAITDSVSNIVKKRGGFEEHARFRGKMVDRLQLIEKLQTQFANVFGVAAIACHAACKNARAAQKFSRAGIVAMRLLARENFPRNFAEKSFANSDARNGERTQIQVAAKRDENQTSDSHDVGAITAHAKSFHARFDVAAQKIGQAFAKKREFESGEAVFAGARCKVGKSFRIAAESDGEFSAEIGTRLKFRFEESVQIFADLFRLRRGASAGNSERGHQADGADRKLGGLNDGMIAENAEFETSAAEIDDTPQRRFGTERGENGFPSQAGFFVGADDFEAKF